VNRRGVFGVFGEHGFEGRLCGIQLTLAVGDDALVEGDFALHRGRRLQRWQCQRESERETDPTASNEPTR
jgi:hypothetical protein